MNSGPRKPKEDARYANFFQVGYNAFEFLLEFGQHQGPDSHVDLCRARNMRECSRISCLER